MKTIARIHNDYNSKFGIPRQSGLVKETESIIVFEPEYRIPEALRGIENYDYIWLLWEFSENTENEWSPTVRPPRLGGNKRMGVFATRSPFRPNSIGLSSVKLLSVEKTNDYGTVLKVSGADLMNGTPIYDIKPYLPYVDSHPEASNGFAMADFEPLEVVIPPDISASIPDDKAETLKAVLSQDPRPQYIEDESRIYGITFADFNVKFRITGNTVFVTGTKKLNKND